MREKLLVILILMLSLGIFFYPASMGKGLIYSGDFTGSDGLDLNLPLKANLGNCLRDGSLPLWTDLLFCGYPLLCEGQTGIFYPPNLIFSLLPLAWCFNGLIFFHLFLAGIGIFLYGRHRNLSFQASLIVCTTYTFNGFFLLNLRHLNTFSAAAWFPILLFCAEKQIATRRPSYLALLAIVLSLQWLIGHPAVVYLGLFGVFLLYLAAYLRDLRSGESGARFYFYPLSFLAAAFFSGILSAVQILPTLELIPISSRALMTLSKLSTFPFTMKSLLHFITPFFLGNPADGSFELKSIYENGVFWENCMYIGILPLIMAVISLKEWKKDERVKYFTFVVLCGIILALGPATAFFRLLWKIVPGFQFFRFPSRFLLYTLIGLSLLCGTGFDIICRNLKNAPVRALFMVFTLLAITLNLYWFNHRFNTVIPAAWVEKPDSMRHLPQVRGESPFRIYSFAAKFMWQQGYLADKGWMGEKEHLRNYRNLLAPDYNLIFGICQSGEKTWIEGGMSPARRTELEQLLEKTVASQVQGNVAVLPDEGVKVLGMLNVRYLLSYFRLENSNLSEMNINGQKDLAGMRIYENRATLPRCYVVDSYRVIEDPGEVLDTLFASDFNPRDEVILEEDPCIPRGENGGSTVEREEYGQNRISLEVMMNAPGILFLSDTCFPGWKVRIDGIEARILKANYAFRGVAVPEGRHRVIFTYEPLSFSIGITFSILGWAVIIGGFLIARMRRKRSAHCS